MAIYNNNDNKTANNDNEKKSKKNKSKNAGDNKPNTLYARK